MNGAGITRKNIEEAYEELRGDTRVTDQTEKAQFEALEQCLVLCLIVCCLETKSEGFLHLEARWGLQDYSDAGPRNVRGPVGIEGLDRRV